MWMWCIRRCVRMWVCKNVRFLFKPYLHNHIPRCHILKTCNLWLVSYSPKDTLKTLDNISLCECFKYKLKLWPPELITIPVAGKTKVVRPDCSRGACVGVLKNKMGVANNNLSFIFSAPICVCNHVARPHILKFMKACAMKMWLLQSTWTENFKS